MLFPFVLFLFERHQYYNNCITYLQELSILLSLSLSVLKYLFIETKHGTRILGQQELAVFLIKVNDPNPPRQICPNPCVLLKR